MNPPADRFIQLFNEANAIPAGAEREQFLAISCGEDAELRDKIEKLLRAHDEAGGFLKVGVAVTPELDAEFARLKPEQIGERIGHYKLLEQIGQGGFGTVWVAEQERPVRRRVALKIIKLGMDTQEVTARFEQERQALAMMDHPNIAKVFDAGATATGRPFFVMELVRGVKITEYCDQANLSTAERLQLFVAVCQAVQHAHQKGIIHRDLKPSNVLVTLHDGVAVPKVIDFGVAKATEQRLTDLTVYTRFEQMVGTPVYMSPEQAEMSGLDIDTRTDIYSLGVLLYELLTGHTPFEPEELMRRGLDEIRRMIREQQPKKPSTLVETMALELRTNVARHRQADSATLARLIRGDLDWIVMKALEKDRARRYATANGLATDIQCHLKNEPVTARPASAGYRFQRLVRRNKLAFAAGTAIVASLIAGLTASTWLYFRERNARARATNAEELAKARLAEVSAERDAKEVALRDAEAIATFMSEVFQSPDPAREGRTVTVAQMLDRAVRKLETELADQPARRAKLYAALGNTYRTLGLPYYAIHLQKKVLDYYQAASGPEHLDTLRAMQDLAISYADAGNRDEALKRLEEVLIACRKRLGPEHRETIRAMQNLALAYYNAGRFQEALDLREESLTLYRKVLGPLHFSTLRAMQNLATSYFASGRQTEALALREEVLAFCNRALAPNPVTLSAMNDLAISYFAAGRRAAALDLREELLALRRSVLGPKHSETVETMQSLASSYSSAGRREEALKLREEVLTIRREISGPEHPDTLDAMTALANSYFGAGRRDEALKLREEVLPLQRKVRGPEHITTLWAFANLALSYVAAGREDEALKMREEGLALRRKVLGPEHPDTFNAMSSLADSYFATGRRDDALKLREEVLTLRRKVLGPEDAATLKAMTNLASSYRANGDVAKAEALEREVTEITAQAKNPSGKQP